jgi:hypothetical protein
LAWRMLTVADVLEIIDLASQTSVVRAGGNSTVAQVEFNEEFFAVKDYSARIDGERRLIQEFSALEFLHPELPAHFARPLGIEPRGTRAVYSWIKGIQPPLNSHTVACMLEIADELHRLSVRGNRKQVKSATDQVLNVGHLNEQLFQRVKTLSANSALVANFTRTRIAPVMHELFENQHETGHALPTLSPSDFGAHNLLWDESSGLMRCVDLEFFGVDDAHKLVCDSLLHPLALWTPICANGFLAGAIDIYQLDVNRLTWLWPFLNLKWAAIILARAERDLQSGNESLALQTMMRASVYVERAKFPTCSIADIVDQVASE